MKATTPPSLRRSLAPAAAALAVAALLLATGAPRAAHAADGDEPTAPKPKAKPKPKTDTSAAATKKDAPSTLSHKYQFGLGVRVGSGYRVIAPYNEENCGEVDKSVCGALYPFWIELSPSFGITSSLELLVDFRIPLQEPDFTTSKGFYVAPGIKYYTDPESVLKFFLTAQVVFENQGQAQASLKSFDFGVRSALGLQFDIIRYVGLYAQAGLVFGFSRWLSFLVDFGGGIQVRY